MMALKATSASTGSTMNQALLFQVVSMSSSLPRISQLDPPGIGIDADPLGREADTRLRRYLLVLRHDGRHLVAFHHRAHDLPPPDVLNAQDRGRHSIAADAHVFRSDAELDPAAFGNRRSARQ